METNGIKSLRQTKSKIGRHKKHKGYEIEGLHIHSPRPAEMEMI
jgi:hypothetical protein